MFLHVYPPLSHPWSSDKDLQQGETECTTLEASETNNKERSGYF